MRSHSRAHTHTHLSKRANVCMLVHIKSHALSSAHTHIHTQAHTHTCTCCSMDAHLCKHMHAHVRFAHKRANKARAHTRALRHARAYANAMRIARTLIDNDWLPHEDVGLSAFDPSSLTLAGRS